MRLIRFLLVTSLATLLGACSSLEISSDYDTTVNFSGLKTYRWMATPAKQKKDPRIDNNLLETRVKTAVDRELKQKGYQRINSGTADFLVGYHAVIEGKMDVQTMNNYYGYSSGWGYRSRPYRYGYYGPSRSDTYVYHYDEGTLTLDIAEPQKRQLIWRGAATGVVDKSLTAKERQALINKAVKEILAHFPPDTGSAKK